MLNNKEAIQAIKNNWPSERYQLLREALILAITALEQTDKEIREAQIRDEILFLESMLEQSGLRIAQEKMDWIEEQLKEKQI